jgi:hypothetical protein
MHVFKCLLHYIMKTPDQVRIHLILEVPRLTSGIKPEPLRLEASALLKSYSKSVLTAIRNIYCTFETRQCEIFFLRFLNGMGLGFVLATTSVYIVEIATTGTYFLCNFNHLHQRSCPNFVFLSNNHFI